MSENLEPDEILSTHELMLRWRIELKRAPCVKNFVIDESGKGIKINFKDNYHCDDCPNEWCFKKGEWVNECGNEMDKLPPQSEPPETNNIPGIDGNFPEKEPGKPTDTNPMFG